MTVIRWLLVPVAALGAWAAALALGLLLTSLVDSWCPPDLMISGLCTAWWHAPAMRAVESLCAAFAAAALVLGTAVVAPSHGIVAATASYLLGAMFAVNLAMAGDLWIACVVAAISGSLSLYVVVARGRARERPVSRRQQPLEERTIPLQRDP